MSTRNRNRAASATPVATEADAPVTPVEAVTETVQEQIQQPAKQPAVAVEEAAPVNIEPVDKFELVRVNGTPSQQAIVAILDKYKKEMAPGVSQSGHDQATQQYYLWRGLVTVINQTPVVEFRDTWSIVLQYFYEERNGVFGENYVFRAADQWRWDLKLLTEFQTLINLMILTRDRNTRALGLKQVDINRTLGSSYTEQGRQKLLTFYGK